MNTSYQEEVLALLAAICSILCFAVGFDTAGWLFGAKAVLDAVHSLHYAIRELRAEKANASNGAAK